MKEKVTLMITTTANGNVNVKCRPSFTELQAKIARGTPLNKPEVYAMIALKAMRGMSTEAAAPPKPLIVQ